MGKSRKGFVTNSSSSSFIFKGYKADGVYYLIREIAEKLNVVKEKLDEVIGDSADYEDLEFVRGFNFMDNTSDWARYFNIKERFERDYRHVVEQFIEEAELYSIIGEDFISGYYMDKYVPKKCSVLLECPTYEEFKEKNSFEMNIYNISDLLSDNCDDVRYAVISMINWYEDDGSERIYKSLIKATKEELYKIALDKLGDAVVSSSDGDIPYIIATELENYTTKQCNHMG